MSDALWKENGDLRERIRTLEIDHDLLKRACEQRFAVYDRSMGLGAQPVVGPAPSQAGQEGSA